MSYDNDTKTRFYFLNGCFVCTVMLLMLKIKFGFIVIKRGQQHRKTQVTPRLWDELLPDSPQSQPTQICRYKVCPNLFRLANECAQVAMFHERHDDVRLAFVDDDAEQRQDIRVVEVVHNRRLLEELRHATDRVGI